MVSLFGVSFNVEMWFHFLGSVLMLKHGPAVGDQNLMGVIFYVWQGN